MGGFCATVRVTPSIRKIPSLGFHTSIQHRTQRSPTWTLERYVETGIIGKRHDLGSYTIGRRYSRTDRAVSARLLGADIFHDTLYTARSMYFKSKTMFNIIEACMCHPFVYAPYIPYWQLSRVRLEEGFSNPYLMWVLIHIGRACTCIAASPHKAHVQGEEVGDGAL